jgi:hypothetical protein
LEKRKSPTKIHHIPGVFWNIISRILWSEPYISGNREWCLKNFTGVKSLVCLNNESKMEKDGAINRLVL